MSGPIAVEGAEPGDCLVVDILDGRRNNNTNLTNYSLNYYLVTPFEQMPWGYTVRLLYAAFTARSETIDRVFLSLKMAVDCSVSILERSICEKLLNFGPAREFNSRACKAIWDFKGKHTLPSGFGLVINPIK